MRLVDLSAPIRPGSPGLPDILRVDVDYEDHAAGAAAIQTLFSVGPELLRDGDGWATDAFTRLGTHNSTHVDAPWHYNSTIAGRRPRRSTSCRWTGSSRLASSWTPATAPTGSR